MLRQVILAGMVIMVAGCASGARAYWVHQSYTPQLWSRDSYECERQAQVPGMVAGVPIGSGIVVGVPIGTDTDSGVLRRCLEARGWRLTWR